MSEVDHPPGQTTVEAQIEKPAQRASEAATMIQEKPADPKSCAFPQTESFPSGSLFYYRDKNGEEYDSVGHAEVGTRIVFQCIDSKSKIAERECLANGTWSAQSAAIKCDPMRYWTAVIAATTSVFIIIVLLIYFTCSAYNKRRKRKYISRKERVREQDDMMLRNENFVRQNFRPVSQLPNMASTVQPTAPPSVASS